MLFNSPEFLVYLVIALPVYYIIANLKPSINNLYLIVASLVFYSYWDVTFLPVILFSVVMNFSVYKLMVRFYDNEYLRRKTLQLGVVVNLLLLGSYKYLDFVIFNINAVLQTDIAPLHIALPLGISFFTFQQIAFLYDSASGKAEVGSFSEYFVFVVFFPQLIAGPIVHHKEMMPQFANRRKGINYNYFVTGCYFFSIGIAKKVLLADKLSPYVKMAYDNIHNLTFFDAWGGALAYTMQIYFDFSGYCDMAIGLGLMFGIKLPINFNSPYKSETIQEFWRRWHITLSRWLRDYLYIPLGGNRGGNARLAINVIIVFFLGGLWHGAAWTFVLWGLMHGLALAVYSVWRIFKIRLPFMLSINLTFLFVVFAWVMFRAESVSAALDYYRAMVGLNGIEFSMLSANLINGLHILPVAITEPKALVVPMDVIPYLFLTFIIVFFCKNSCEMVGYDVSLAENTALKISNKLIIFSALLFAFTLANLKTPSEFIYFNF